MKKLLIILCVTAVLITGGAGRTPVNTFADSAPHGTQMLERLAATVMQPGIKSAINTFYGQYLNQLPEVNVPDIKIIDITSYNGGVFFDVTAEVKSFIENNIPIGQDKISLSVNVFGLVEAKRFEHLKNIGLPSNYKDRILKPLPEKTVADLPLRNYPRSGNQATPDYEKSKAQKLDALVRVLVISEVQNAVNVFYFPYLSSPQINAYYGYKIIEITENKNETEILSLVVTITPYTGAHNSIGKERITMDIWNTGEVFVTDYEHLETYDIVPWLKENLKKPLPEGKNYD